MTREEAMVAHNIGGYPHIKLKEALYMALSTRDEREQMTGPCFEWKKWNTNKLDNIELRRILNHHVLWLESKDGR